MKLYYSRLINKYKKVDMRIKSNNNVLERYIKK